MVVHLPSLFRSLDPRPLSNSGFPQYTSQECLRSHYHSVQASWSAGWSRLTCIHNAHTPLLPASWHDSPLRPVTNCRLAAWHRRGGEGYWRHQGVVLYLRPPGFVSWGNGNLWLPHSGHGKGLDGTVIDRWRASFRRLREPLGILALPTQSMHTFRSQASVRFRACVLYVASKGKTRS